MYVPDQMFVMFWNEKKKFLKKSVVNKDAVKGRESPLGSFLPLVKIFILRVKYIDCFITMYSDVWSD